MSGPVTRDDALAAADALGDVLDAMAQAVNVEAAECPECAGRPDGGPFCGRCAGIALLVGVAVLMLDGLTALVTRGQGGADMAGRTLVHCMAFKPAGSAPES